MVRIHEIIDSVLSYHPQADVRKIEQAYVYSAKVHKGDVRLSGEPYLSHLLETASILAKMRMDVDCIVAGLLHDTIEDTNTTYEELKELFGEAVANIVEGVTKISKLQLEDSIERAASNIRKILFAMSNDIRVILVKLADRLHNMRTLGFHKPEKQIQIARETLDIFAPIAARLGIHWLKSELEDLCLYYLDPVSYNEIKDWVAIRKEQKTKFIQEIKQTIQTKLLENGIQAVVKGRFKHIYSIYRKMKARGVSIKDIQDILAFRIIVNDVRECYEAMGYIHSMWTPVQRFKDYIGAPKPNGYKSLHTIVMGPSAERMEIQIRTHDMDKEAEEGISAHWNYKEGGRATQQDIEHFNWLRSLLEWQIYEDPKDYLIGIKRELKKEDEIYVFTPKGKPINLPKGATAIDFAYEIHTDIGHRCVGAKVNGKMVPITHVLQTGDVVEIVTSSKQKPSRDWLKYVKTSKAIAKIKHFLKAQERDQAIEIGKSVWEREAIQQGVPLEKVEESTLEEMAKEFSLKSVNDMFQEIGFGNISARQVIGRLRQRLGIKEQEKELPLSVERAPKEPSQRGIKVKGVEGILIRFPNCCKPLPGEKVVGFLTKGRGISIHRRTCKNVLKNSNGRLLEIEWEPSGEQYYPARIKIIGLDRKGLLADITGLLSKKNANILSLDVKTTKDKKGTGLLTIEVRDINHLQEILTSLRALKDVLKVQRF